MGIIKDIKNCFSFLTRFPIGKEINLTEDLAPKIWIFPVVGLVLGLTSSFASLILFKFLPSLLVGFITLGFLLLMTGVHHTDGLIDFGDGLMAMGTPERKIEVMHDVAIGVGGFALGFIVLALTGLAISYSMNFIIIALVLSEIVSKFNMVAACSVGKSANTKMADPFIRSNTKKHLVFSLSLSIGLIFFTIFLIMILNSIYSELIFLKFLFSPVNEISLWNFAQVVLILIIFLIGTIIPLLIVLNLASRNFNGLTGDCLGALNEITRVFILIFILILGALNLV